MTNQKATQTELDAAVDAQAKLARQMRLQGRSDANGVLENMRRQMEDAQAKIIIGASLMRPFTNAALEILTQAQAKIGDIRD